MILPLATSWFPIFRTRLLGMAKPAPALIELGTAESAALRMSELMPMTSPWIFNSGPPLLPVLIHASVWMKSS